MEVGSVKTALWILCLAANPDDRQLIEQTLASEGWGCAFVHVETPKEFETTLRQRKFDLIRSDYNLPSYSGMAAPAAARALQPVAHFIMVPGTIGEQRAVESLKSGATDDALKSHLGRWVPVVRRAFRDADVQTQRNRATLLGGELDMFSLLDWGTTVKVRVPVESLARPKPAAGRLARRHNRSYAPSS